MKKIRRIPLGNIWILCVMSGVLMGTLWANLLGGKLMEQVGYFDGVYGAGKALSEEERWQLWRYVIRQRLWEAGLGGLIAMTPLAVPGYLAGAFGAGFILAVIIAMFTLEKGWLGIAYWLLSAMPHGLCYLAVWMTLTAAVMGRRDMKKIRVWLLAGILVAAGSFLEAWVNHMLLELL